MGLFSKAKPGSPEHDERDEAEESYRLFKLVSRAWKIEPGPVKKEQYKSA